VLTAFANAWHADRTGERYLHITIPLWVAVAAFILAAATTTTAPRYLAMMLMVPGVYTVRQPLPPYSTCANLPTGLRRRPSLDLQYPPPPARQTRRRPRTHKRLLKLLLHLRIVHVPIHSRPAVRGSYVC
jgi:hypothetical protein